MKKTVKLTSEKYSWTCPECDKPHVLFVDALFFEKSANEVRCGVCGEEFITAQYCLKQELKLTQERLKMVEYTLEQYKTILVDGIPKLVDPKNVIVHYRCCECKATVDVPLKNIRHISICEECSYMENFMEIVAVGIKVD
jgi:ribosomal protein S27E